MAKLNRKEKKKMKKKVLVSDSGRYEMRIQAAHRHPDQIATLRISRRQSNGEFADIFFLTGEELLTALESEFGSMKIRDPIVNV